MQPAKILSHGSGLLRGVVDEVSPTPALKVEEFGADDNRALEWIKDVDMCDVRSKALNPTLQMSLKGQASLTTGLVAANTGSKLTSLANFTNPLNGYDPADGSMIVTSNKSTQARIQDQLKIDIGVHHKPYIVDA